MRILYVAEISIPSNRAYALHAVSMSSAYSSLGHDVSLFSSRYGNSDNEDPEEIYSYYGIKNNFIHKRFKFGSIRFISGFLFAFKIFIRVLFSKGFDFIHTRHIYSAFLLVLLGNRVAYEIHMPLKNSQQVFILKLIALFGVKLIVITESLKEYITNEYSISKEKIFVFPDASFPQNFKPHLSNTKVDVGYVGNLFPGKGMELIYLIANKLPEVTFHIVGGNETEINYWKKKITKGNVIFHGYVKPADLRNFYNLFSIALLPNQKKVSPDGISGDIGSWTSPMKLFEYMSWSKVIISSDIPILREVLVDKKNAFLVKHDNADEWAERIIKLSKDKSIRNEISKEGNKQVASYLNWKNRCQKIIRFCNE